MWFLALAAIFSPVAEAGCPPGAVCVDPESIRTNIGLSQTCMGAGEAGLRCAPNLTLGFGSGLLSAILGRREGLSAHDDMWLDMGLGRLQGERLVYYSTPESRFSVWFDTGYYALLGWNTGKWGLYGGMGVRYATGFVGDTSNFDASKASLPVVVRGQLQWGDRVARAFVWSSLRHHGARADFPLSHWVALSGQVLHTRYPTTAWDDSTGKGMTSLTVSIRTSFMD